MSPQQTIAHYRITAKLGEGGMGEVWRATDTKLNRDVAIKILPEAFAQDADRMARFEREAQVLASLNHPNIAAIYGVEERALIMELVEGETLHSPLPIETALNYAKQIAEALEYAHERGVVHRDLKPANIKVTPEGRVKVLDFGLAKAMSSEAASGNPESSPTLTMRATMTGVILGTAAYMSPEQAAGKPVDKRADIWSYGVVLWEMLVGKRLFDGETVSHTLADVLRAPIDFGKLPADTPTTIRELLRRCLDRDVKIRLRDIGEARVGIAAAPPEPPPAIAPVQSRGVPAWCLAVASLLALAGGVITVMHFREKPPEPTVVRFQVPPPEKAIFSGEVGFRMDLSPDGRRLAFLARSADGRLLLWVRPFDSVDAHPLSGTENASSLFWSPDSRWIGFHADGKLKKIEAAGGPPQTLCSLPGSTVVTGSWNRDGDILFANPGASGGLLRVSQAGGAVTSVTTPDRSRQEVAHAYPYFLPDGRHFLYLARATVTENTGIYLATLGATDRKLLLRTIIAAIYAPAPSGHEGDQLLFLRDGTLMAQPMNARTLEMTGEAFLVAEHVGSYLSYGAFSASTNGALAYRSGAGTFGNSLVMWFDRDGKSLGAVSRTRIYTDLALSPDEKRLAVSDRDPQAGNRDIWLFDLQRGVPQRFTFEPSLESTPIWSPDGSKVAFASNRDGLYNIYQKESGGTGTEQALLKSDASKYPLDWSPDGRYLLYYMQDLKNKGDLWVLPVNPPGKPMPFVQSPFTETQGQFSRGPGGGRWVAYASDESGAFQVYVQPFPPAPSGGGSKFQISTGGGLQPRWRGDGKELFYLASDGKLMAVEVKTSPRFEAGIPRALFAPRITGGIGMAAPGSRYAVSRDGKRFVMNVLGQAEEPDAAPVTIVLNWTAGLKK
jgi:Tol biopolymer transport system component/predicted Ser/Thr protein kinase